MRQKNLHKRDVRATVNEMEVDLTHFWHWNVKANYWIITLGNAFAATLEFKHKNEKLLTDCSLLLITDYIMKTVVSNII